MKSWKRVIAVVAFTLVACTTLQPYRQALIPDQAIDFEAAQSQRQIHDAIKAQMWEHYRNPDLRVSAEAHVLATRAIFRFLAKF